MNLWLWILIGACAWFTIGCGVAGLYHAIKTRYIHHRRPAPGTVPLPPSGPAAHERPRAVPPLVPGPRQPVGELKLPGGHRILFYVCRCWTHKDPGGLQIYTWICRDCHDLALWRKELETR